jgi:hypothetical protein
MQEHDQSLPFAGLEGECGSAVTGAWVAEVSRVEVHGRTVNSTMAADCNWRLLEYIESNHHEFRAAS